MFEINPSDLAVRNCKVGETYILVCSLKNATELVLNCELKTSKACLGRWHIEPRKLRFKPRQVHNVELKLHMKQLPSSAGRRAMASGGLKDLFYLKTQYFEQRFHVLLFGSVSKFDKDQENDDTEGKQSVRKDALGSSLDLDVPPLVEVEAGLHRLGLRCTDLEIRERALQKLVSQLEKLVSDKDEVIQMLQKHFRMSERNESLTHGGQVQVPTRHLGPPHVQRESEEKEKGSERKDTGHKDKEAQEIASVLGANAQLRSKVSDLSLLLEEKEKELGIAQEALKAIGSGQPKLKALANAAVEKERSVHESRNRKVLEMFTVKDSKIAQLESKLEDSKAVVKQKDELISEFKSQITATETKVIELLNENQDLQKENYQLKDDNVALSHFKPSSVSKTLESQLVKSKEMNEELSSKLKETQALEEFSKVKNQSLSGSLQELQKSLASVVAENAEKMRAKEREILLLTQRLEHNQKLLSLKGGETWQGASGSQHWDTSGKGEGVSTSARSDNLDSMLQIKTEEISHLKAKLKKLETIHEKAKQTAIDSETKMNELLQKSKNVNVQRMREENRNLKMKLQNLSRENRTKLEQKESVLRIEKAKSEGLMNELVKERERSVKAATAFSGADEREAMEKKVETSAASLKECQDALQIIQAKYVHSEEERRRIDSIHRNHKAESTRKILLSEQKVRTAELHSQQHIKDLEHSVRILSGRSKDHRELASAREEVVSLGGQVKRLQSDNEFLNDQIRICEEKLQVAQLELQQHLSYGDLKEFRQVYGKFISDSVVIVELSQKLHRAEKELKDLRELAPRTGTSEKDSTLLSNPQPVKNEMHSIGVMAKFYEVEAEESTAAESKVVSLQAKVDEFTLYVNQLKAKVISKEKALAAAQDDLKMMKSRSGSVLKDSDQSPSNQFVSLEQLEEAKRGKRDAESRLGQVERKLLFVENQIIQKEKETKEESARLCKKLEESRSAEMETRRQLTEKACSLDEKSVQVKIMKEALNALKLGYVSNPCDEEHIVLVSKVASAEAKDLAHRRHIQYLVEELDLKSEVIQENRKELDAVREDCEKLRVQVDIERERNAVSNKQVKEMKVELSECQDKYLILEGRLQQVTDQYSRIKMEQHADKQVIENQRRRHTELIAAERQTIVDEIEAFKVEHCNICESSRNVTRFMTEHDDALTALTAAIQQPQQPNEKDILPHLSSLKYLGLEASRLFALSQTSQHILSTENEILSAKLRDVELKNECLADKLASSDSMNLQLNQCFGSKCKLINQLIEEGGQESLEKVRRLTKALELAQRQTREEYKKRCEASVKGKILEQKYLQLKCEVESWKAEKEAAAPAIEIEEVSTSDISSEPGNNDIAQTLSKIASFKLAESHLVQQVVISNKRAEKANAELKHLSRSFKELSSKVDDFDPQPAEDFVGSQVDMQIELTAKSKENFELSQKVKHLSVEVNLQKDETLVANNKVQLLEKTFRDSLKTVDTALNQQRAEQQELIRSIIKEVHAEVAQTFNAIFTMVKNSQENNRESKQMLLDDFKQIRGTAKQHSIHALANLSYLDIEGMPVVKVSDLREMKLQKRILEEENEKLLKRLENKEKEVLELTEDVESQKLALRDLSNTFSKSAFKKMHSSGMLKSTLSTLNKKLVECKLVQADMQRKLKISARAELELRQLLHSREQRLTTLNTEVQAYNQALDSIQKFAAKEKNLEFKRILREVVLNLSTMNSQANSTPDPDMHSSGSTFKIDAQVGIFSGMRIQIAEKNARISHLEQKISEYLASAPIKTQQSKDSKPNKDMLREISKYNDLLKEAIEDAISKITREVGGEQKPGTLDQGIEMLLDKVKHADLMFNRSQAKVKDLRSKMKDTKTEDVNASLQNAVKGLSEKCRTLVMEKAELKLERDRLLERITALKSSINKSKKEKMVVPQRRSMKKPEIKSVNASPDRKTEGGTATHFTQINSFADMIDVHLSAIRDFILKFDQEGGIRRGDSTKIEEDFSSIGSLVCIIKDTLKIVATEISDGKPVSLPTELKLMKEKTDKSEAKMTQESEWEKKYSSLKKAYSTYRKSSNVEMNALKEKNMNASAQVIEAAKDKVSMQVELREMQRMVEKGIIDIDLQQKSRSRMALKLTEKEAQLRIAKSKAKLGEAEAQEHMQQLQKELKVASKEIENEREERGKVLLILRKAVNDLKTQLHIEFDLRNQLYQLELEKENAITSCQNKENQLDSQSKDHKVTGMKVAELEESLIRERQHSHKLKVRYEYMREGLKQLEIRFNAADKHRVMLERCVDTKIAEAEKIADSISIVDFGKAPMMILLEVQEIEKLISKMSLDIQKEKKAREEGSDKWKFTSRLIRYKRAITDWKRFEEGKLKKKITELQGGMKRIQNQNIDLVLCSEKAAGTITNLQELVDRLQREKKSMSASLNNAKDVYYAELSKSKIEMNKEAVIEQQGATDLLSREIEDIENELKSFKEELSGLKDMVKVDARKIISEFHENNELSRKEILSLISSLEKLIPGLNAKKAFHTSRPPPTKVEKAKIETRSDFTSKAIEEIQGLEDQTHTGNMELKLKLQSQLTKKAEKIVAKLKAEIQDLKQELKSQAKKYQDYPSKADFEQKEKALAECKKALKESKAQHNIKGREVKALKEQLVEARKDSSEVKLKEAIEKADSLQKKLRGSLLSIQRKDVILNELRQNIKDLQRQDLTEKMSKTESKNKQLALTVQRQSVAIKELRTSANEASKSLETIVSQEKSEQSITLQKKYRGDMKRKDAVITQLQKNLEQVEEDLSAALTKIEEANKREGHGRKAAEHDWLACKTFMKSATSALEKMSKIVVQGSNEMRTVVQAVAKAEKFHSIDSSPKNIAQLVDMSPAEVEDIMQVEEGQSKRENLEHYLIHVFDDIRKEIESIHQVNIMRGKDKFVAKWDPTVLLSLAEILEKEFIHVRVMLGASLKVLPEVIPKLPKRKAQKPTAPKKGLQQRRKSSLSGKQTPAEASSSKKSGRDMLIEELEILAKRVKK